MAPVRVLSAELDADGAGHRGSSTWRRPTRTASRSSNTRTPKSPPRRRADRCVCQWRPSIRGTVACGVVVLENPGFGVVVVTAHCLPRSAANDDRRRRRGAGGGPQGQPSGQRSAHLEHQAIFTLVLDLDLSPRVTAPDPRIDAIRGTVAFERGPLVSCIESADLPAGVTPSNLSGSIPMSSQGRSIARTSRHRWSGSPRWHAGENRRSARSADPRLSRPSHTSPGRTAVPMRCGSGSRLVRSRPTADGVGPCLALRLLPDRRLRLHDEPIPEPGPGEALIRVGEKGWFGPPLDRRWRDLRCGPRRAARTRPQIQQDGLDPCR